MSIDLSYKKYNKTLSLFEQLETMNFDKNIINNTIIKEEINYKPIETDKGIFQITYTFKELMRKNTFIGVGITSYKITPITTISKNLTRLTNKYYTTENITIIFKKHFS